MSEKQQFFVVIQSTSEESRRTIRVEWEFPQLNFEQWVELNERLGSTPRPEWRAAVSRMEGNRLYIKLTNYWGAVEDNVAKDVFEAILGFASRYVPELMAG